MLMNKKTVVLFKNEENQNTRPINSRQFTIWWRAEDSTPPSRATNWSTKINQFHTLLIRDFLQINTDTGVRSAQEQMRKESRQMLL